MQESAGGVMVGRRCGLVVELLLLPEAKQENLQFVFRWETDTRL